MSLNMNCDFSCRAGASRIAHRRCSDVAAAGTDVDRRLGWRRRRRRGPSDVSVARRVDVGAAMPDVARRRRPVLGRRAADAVLWGHGDAPDAGRRRPDECVAHRRRFRRRPARRRCRRPHPSLFADRRRRPAAGTSAAPPPARHPIGICLLIWF